MESTYGNLGGSSSAEMCNGTAMMDRMRTRAKAVIDMV